MPSWLSRLSAGLVIRTNEVELLAMKGSRVLSHVRVPTAGARRHDLIHAIQHALEMSGVKTRRMAVAMPTEDVLIRFFHMPLLPKAERDTAVQFEARKYIPFKIEDLVWDYYAGESKETNKLEVTFAAVQRSVFEQLQAVLVEAGIQPTTIEPRSLSLARLAAAPHARAFACLVDVDEGHAHLVIAKGGVPFLTRDVAFTGEASEATAPIDSRAQRLCSELRVSMDFFTREYPAATIPQVILVGNEGLIGGWHAWLAQQLGCAVGLGRDLVTSRVDGDLPLDFATAVGLVQQGTERGEVSLDFFRRSTAKATSQPSRAVRLTSSSRVVQELMAPRSVAVMCAIAGLLAVLWVLGSQRVVRETQRLATLVQARPVVGWGLEGMDQANVELIREKAMQQLGLLKRVVDGRVGVVAKLDALPRSLSDGMWLTEILFEEKLDPNETRPVTMKVSGACYLEQAGKELSAIQAFESRVKNTPALFQGFQVAAVEQITEQRKAQDKTQVTYRTFQLQCRSDRTM